MSLLGKIAMGYTLFLISFSVCSYVKPALPRKLPDITIHNELRKLISRPLFVSVR